MQSILRLFIRRGRIAWPLGGGQWKETVRERDKVLEEAVRLYKRHDALYVVDVDGLEHGEPSLDLYQKLERQGVFPWLEGGFRKVEDIMDAFFAGADRVTIRIGDMNPEKFKDLTSIAEGEIFLSVPIGRHGPSEGWREDQVADYAVRIGARGVVLDALHDASVASMDLLGTHLRQSGLQVAVSSYAGTRPTVDSNLHNYIILDME